MRTFQDQIIRQGSDKLAVLILDESYYNEICLDAWQQGMADAANIAMRSQRSETVVAQNIQAAARERMKI